MDMVDGELTRRGFPEDCLNRSNAAEFPHGLAMRLA